MRSYPAALAVAVLLAAASSSYAQLFFSTGPLPVYGFRGSYAGPLLGAPLYGAPAYGTYGYNYGTYAYGAPAPDYYRYGLFGRRTSLRRALWIFGPQYYTPTTTPSTPTVDGSTINVTPLGPARADFTAEIIAEAKNWQFDLRGEPRPKAVVTGQLVLYFIMDPTALRADVAKVLRSPTFADYCKAHSYSPLTRQLGSTSGDRFKAEVSDIGTPALVIETEEGKVLAKSKLPAAPASEQQVKDLIASLIAKGTSQ